MLAPLLQLVKKATDTINSKMDVALSTRASQASLDAMPTTPINRIQRGNSSGMNTTLNITITSVNTAKTVVNLLCSAGGIGMYWDSHGGHVVYTWRQVSARLTSATNLAITIQAPHSMSNISWEVIEYK